MNNYLLIIPLNVNGLNAPIKRHRIGGVLSTWGQRPQAEFGLRQRFPWSKAFTTDALRAEELLWFSKALSFKLYLISFNHSNDSKNLSRCPELWRTLEIQR